MNFKTLAAAFVFLLLTSTAHAQPIRNAVPDVARPLPLSSVRVTGGPLKRAQDLESLQPERTRRDETLLTSATRLPFLSDARQL